MSEQDNRIYAASLLNRAGLQFDTRDLAVVAKVVTELEMDLLAELGRRIGNASVMRDQGHWPQPQANSAIEQLAATRLAVRSGRYRDGFVSNPALAEIGQREGMGRTGTELLHG